MTIKTPIRLVLDGSNNPTGLAEFQTGEIIGVSFGGTGNSTLTSNSILLGNGTSAVQSSSIQIIGTTLSSSDSSTININEGLVVEGNLTVTGSITGTIANSSLSNSSITISDDTSSTTTISLGETLKIAGGSGVDTTISGDTITIALESSVVTETSTDTLTNKSISLTTNTISGTLAEFNTALSDDNFVSLTGAETLTNKTLTSPVISSISNTGTLTLPTSTDTLVGRATTDTFTNKSISGSSNTLTNIANSSLTNSSFTLTDDSSSTTTISLGETLKVSGTTNEIQTSISGDTIVIGLPDNVTIGSNLTVSGDLIVNGTTTTINSTTVTVDDKNIELASVATPTDTTADGAGITIKGTTDKTFNWLDATDSFTSSEHIDLASGKVFKINNSTVLSSSQVLGKSVPSGTIVGTSDSQTLTNKTINFADNTVTATSSQLATAISDETGSGSLVFATSPTLVTPILGVASATSINKLSITAPATGSTLTIADGKTLTASNTLTFTGTDSSSVAFGTGGTVAYTSNKLSVFAATTSSELAGVISDETGSGALVFANSPTLTTPIISSISNSGTLTLPTSTDTLVGRATTDTLTNKTLTSPKINENVAVTATATQINYLVGTTSAIQTQLDAKASRAFAIAQAVALG